MAVKGIGLWSAQMFLIIHLRRPDVLPVGDLGIRKAIMILYGLPALPGPAEVIAIGSRGARIARSPASTCGDRCTRRRSEPAGAGRALP